MISNGKEKKSEISASKTIVEHDSSVVESKNSFRVKETTSLMDEYNSERKSLDNSTSTNVSGKSQSQVEGSDKKASVTSTKEKNEQYVIDYSTIKIDIEEDECDCNVEDCSGCYFPCEKCKSSKCGHECRVGREWKYISWEVQGERE